MTALVLELQTAQAPADHTTALADHMTAPVPALRKPVPAECPSSHAELERATALKHSTKKIRMPMSKAFPTIQI